MAEVAHSPVSRPHAAHRTDLDEPAGSYAAPAEGANTAEEIALDPDTRVRQIPGYRRLVAALTGAMFLLCAAWAITTPAFHGPDESYHYNSVIRLARGGGWPRPYEALVMGATRQAMLEADPGGRGREPVDAVPPAPERSGATDSRGQTAGPRDQMVQHPPGYYLLAAAPVKLAGVSKLRWDHAMLIARLVSAVILAMSLPFLIGTVSRLTGDHLAGLVGGTAVIGIPFFTTMGGYISNDTLLITAASASLWSLVRTATEPAPPWWIPIAGGAALGVALFSKGYGLHVVPIYVLFGLLALIRRHRRRGSSTQLAIGLGSGLIAALAIGGWWWIRNLIVIGKLQPSTHGNLSTDHPFEGYRLTTYLRDAVEQLSSTFWSRGLRADVAYPPTFHLLASAVLIAICVYGVVRSRRRLETSILLLLPVAIATTFILNGLRIHKVTETIRGVQGRYIYCGIAAFAAVIGSAALDLGRRLNRTVLRIVLPIVVLAPWLSALWALHWTATRSRAGRPKVYPLDELRDRSGLPVDVLLVVTILLIVGWCAWTLTRGIGHGAADDRSPVLPGRDRT